MNDPRNYYKKKTLVDFLGSAKSESQSAIPEASILKLSQEFKNSFGGINDLFIHKTPNPTAAEHRHREEQRLKQWRKEEVTRRYTRNQQKLLSSIKGLLKDFEGYQLLLQSDSYRQLQQLVQDIENVPESAPEEAINNAYLDALRYGLGMMKSP